MYTYFLETAYEQRFMKSPTTRFDTTGVYMFVRQSLSKP
jgi:hypothetical protein